MPTITLQDGQVVHISQESYDALKEAVKPKELTYDEVARRLFAGKTAYYTSDTGMICKTLDGKRYNPNDPNNAPTENQVRQLLALNKLFNVAYYLNEGWTPDWETGRENKYFIGLEHEFLVIGFCFYGASPGVPYFKSEELAERAIAILGEKAIKECFGIFE